MGFMYKLTSAILQPVSDNKVTTIIDAAGGLSHVTWVLVLYVSV